MRCHRRILTHGRSACNRNPLDRTVWILRKEASDSTDGHSVKQRQSFPQHAGKVSGLCRSFDANLDERVQNFLCREIGGHGTVERQAYPDYTFAIISGVMEIGWWIERNRMNRHATRNASRDIEYRHAAWGQTIWRSNV